MCVKKRESVCVRMRTDNNGYFADYGPKEKNWRLTVAPTDGMAEQKRERVASETRLHAEYSKINYCCRQENAESNEERTKC